MRLGGRMAAAMEIIADIEARHRPVADALKDWGLSHRFAGSGDRAAIGNVVYDVLRRKRSLAWRMEAETPDALVFAAMLTGQDMSPNDLRQALDGDRFAPPLPDDAAFERCAARDLAEAPDAVRADLPEWLAAHFKEAFGEDWVAEAAALAERPPLDMRANALKATRDKVVKALAPFSTVETALAPEGLRIAPTTGAARHPNVQVEAAFQKGWFEIQDEGSQLAARLAGARAGMQVLDFCAGAGGKTLALAAAMENSGQIHAYDADRQRLAPIHDRLARAGARNVQVHAPRDDLGELRERMNLVLVDAPCTGTGTWRRRPDAKWRLSEAALEKRLGEQDAALDAASAFVRPVGRLVYITCSLLPQENRERIAAFLERHPDFAVLDAQALWRESLPDAAPAYHAVAAGEGRALMLTPLRSGTDGFFFAALERR
ncbi:RsmB/NOP family class I SAM-dependent RNA methyltransferase [Consotaella salsifontis]|uniref:16S rRNA (Cytosine967-C5)-methyltransferase n=1 Tax=Consotaella salsifontis TaxID=1365950 RepID=A0A1T4ST99_9HYPH|nr:RsmB/NOP family class I SAM-dependent RNA methyltransferase [Consotaella salsifontis]SKA31484.1 16S rRNA (cytosine967-C5)-methyltransferase [Consotaella salsifontis]